VQRYEHDSYGLIMGSAMGPCECGKKPSKFHKIFDSSLHSFFFPMVQQCPGGQGFLSIEAS
jgi:hypothetical protein